MIATEEKENKVKYAWKKPTIGNLTAGLSLPLVFCLLSRRNWGFAAKDHNKHHGSQKSFTGRCLRFDRCLCPMSALCPGQKRLICITGEQGCRYSFHHKVQLRGSFKRMNEYTTRTHGIAIPQHFGPFSPLTEIWSGVSKSQEYGTRQEMPSIANVSDQD